MKTLQENWREYRDKCYPKGTTATQNKECHQAFFAGVACLLGDLGEIITMEESDALKQIEKIYQEAFSVLQNFIDLSKRN